MKKYLCTVISLLVITPLMCCGVTAENSIPDNSGAVTVKVYDVFLTGKAKPGHTLAAGCELSDGADGIIKWYRDENQISDADSYEYTLTADDAQRNIKVGVTPVGTDGAEGTEVFSQPVSVSSVLNKCHAKNGTNIADYCDAPLEKNNPDYVFSENGYTYTYLAAEENGMYVIADDAAGRVKLAEDPEDNYFNPEEPSSIAYWLNHDYLDGMVGSGGKKLNPHAADYLKEREYLTEGNGISDMASKEDYVVKCKIALPAFYEFTTEYSDIIGYNPTGSSYYMVFRTPVSNNRTSCPNLKTDTGAVGVSVVTTANKNYMNLSLRVCMLIGYDFFKEYKLDMSMGKEVKAFLRSKFTREEMAETGYTDEELLQIGYAGSTVHENDFTIAGIRSAKQMLSIENIREIPDNLNFKYSWYYSDSRDGQFKKIVSANQKDYIIEDRLVGKYIKARFEIYDAETGEKYGTVEKITDVIAEARALTVVAEGFDNHSGNFKVNNTGEETAICFIASAFDEDNRMIACTAKTESVTLGEHKISISLQKQNAYSYRLMAWETAEAEKLLCGKTVRQ